MSPDAAARTPEPIDFLPLTPVAFEILLALADHDRHGYAIMRSIEERTSGALSLHAGTLYRAVARLVDSGLLRELDEAPAGEDEDERRRYYGITDLGRRVAAAESARLESQLSAARALRLTDRPETA